jgi:hypothetical protein
MSLFAAFGQQPEREQQGAGNGQITGCVISAEGTCI